MKHDFALGAAAISLLLAGCTHHSVRIEAVQDPANRLIVMEQVRPWPVTLYRKFEVTLPSGDYNWDPHDYEIQNNFPEKPIRSIKYSEITLHYRNQLVMDIDGGWIAVFRDSIELQLLWGGQPASINGRYPTKIPFIHPKP